MKDAKMISNVIRLFKKTEHNLYLNVFLPALGAIPLAYVFYTGFFDLPPLLNTPVIFFALFIGLSLVLHWRQGFFILPFLAGYIGLFFLPLTWLWRGLEFDDNVLMGIFPFNDGMYYLADAYRLNAGLEVMLLQNGRPLFPGLLAFFIWMFDGNLQTALALFGVCTALSIFLLALEVRELAGPFAAAMTTSVLFYFSLPFLGRVHTENLGLIFGALGLALLLRGARRKSVAVLAIGALALSMGLSARAGAFFALPFLAYWGWTKRKIFGWNLPWMIIAAMSIGFVLNSYLISAFGASDEVAFSNYGHSLYGLASGYKGWAYVYSVHPEFTNNSNVFPEALELILKNPLMLVWGVILNYKDYFSPNDFYNLTRFGDQQLYISWFLYLATLAGGYRLIKSQNELHWSLVAFVAVGIFLSMAIIPRNDGGLRVLMTTHPFNVLLIGLAFSSAPQWKKDDIGNASTGLMSLYAILLTVACVLGPLAVVRFSQNTPPAPTITCPEGTEQISLLVAPGGYINIVNTGPTFGFLPEVKRADIKTRLDDYYLRGDVPYDALTNFPAFERLVKRLLPGDTILIGLNLVELHAGNGPDKFVFLITRTKQIEQIGEINHFCARLAVDERLRGNRFYFDLSVDILE